MRRGIRREWVARNEAQQVELACRILENKHFNDVVERAKKELDDRYALLGPLDLTRNLGLIYTGRVVAARSRPPLVSGMPAAIAHALGDQSAATLIRRYRDAGGAPLPTSAIQAGTRAQRYQAFAGYAGIAINWSAGRHGVYLDVIRPSDLALVYGDDDPTEPTIIGHKRIRTVDGKAMEVVDQYDLTDRTAPVLRVLRLVEGQVSDQDITEDVFTAEDLEQFWQFYRDSNGRAIHKIVVTGHPDRVWDANALVDGTLKLCVLYTHHGAGIRDSCYAARNVMDMEQVGASSNEGTRSTGTESGPEYVHHWSSTDPERPGQHWQDVPPYDPELVGRAIRDYELGLLNTMGLPISFERTGGDPTEHERRALQEVIAATYPTCRQLDGAVVQRVASLLNRVGEASGSARVYPEVSEAPYAVLYRDEIDEALTTSAAGGGDKVADTAMNGAQVQAATGIVSLVAQSQLPRESGVAMLTQFFSMSPDVAEKLMGPAGRDFKPAVEDETAGAAA